MFGECFFHAGGGVTVSGFVGREFAVSGCHAHIPPSWLQPGHTDMCSRGKNNMCSRGKKTATSLFVCRKRPFIPYMK